MALPVSLCFDGSTFNLMPLPLKSVNGRKGSGEDEGNEGEAVHCRRYFKFTFRPFVVNVPTAFKESRPENQRDSRYIDYVMEQRG